MENTHRGPDPYQKLLAGGSVPVASVTGIGLRGMARNFKILWGITTRKYVVVDGKIRNNRV